MYLRRVVPFGRSVIPISDIPTWWCVGDTDYQDDDDDLIAQPQQSFQIATSHAKSTRTLSEQEKYASARELCTTLTESLSWLGTSSFKEWLQYLRVLNDRVCAGEAPPVPISSSHSEASEDEPSVKPDPSTNTTTGIDSAPTDADVQSPGIESDSMNEQFPGINIEEIQEHLQRSSDTSRSPLFVALRPAVRSLDLSQVLTQVSAMQDEGERLLNRYSDGLDTASQQQSTLPTPVGSHGSDSEVEFVGSSSTSQPFSTVTEASAFDVTLRTTDTNGHPRITKAKKNAIHKKTMERTMDIVERLADVDRPLSLLEFRQALARDTLSLVSALSTVDAILPAYASATTKHPKCDVRKASTNVMSESAIQFILPGTPCIV